MSIALIENKCKTSKTRAYPDNLSMAICFWGKILLKLVISEQTLQELFRNYLFIKKFKSPYYQNFNKINEC